MSSITKKEITLEECLQTLSEKEIKKLSKKVKKECKIKGEVKREDIKKYLISDFIDTFMLISDDDFKQLENIVNGKDVANLNPSFYDYNIVYEMDNQYVMPKEYKESIISLIKDENYRICKLNVIMLVYMNVNGVLSTSKLQELLKKSGFSITKKDILKKVTEFELVRKENLIYLNRFLMRFDEEIGTLSEEKNKKEYRVYDMREALVYSDYGIDEKTTNKLDKIFSKKDMETVKKETWIEYVLDAIKLGSIPEQLLKETLENASLTSEEQERFNNILDEYSRYVPLWIENGYSKRELDLKKEIAEKDKIIEELNKEVEEKNKIHEELEKEAYLVCYITMNGVMEIEKFKSIMEEEHNYKLTNEDIISLVNKRSDLILSGQYIQFMNLSEDNRNIILEEKEQFEKYKVIDNLNKVFDSQDKESRDSETIQNKYNLDEDIINRFRIIMYLGRLDEEEIESILNEYDVNLSSSKVNALTKELKKIALDVPIWTFNGYSKKRIKLYWS